MSIIFSKKLGGQPPPQFLALFKTVGASPPVPPEPDAPGYDNIFNFITTDKKYIENISKISENIGRLRYFRYYFKISRYLSISANCTKYRINIGYLSNIDIYKTLHVNFKYLSIRPAAQVLKTHLSASRKLIKFQNCETQTRNGVRVDDVLQKKSPYTLLPG